MSPINAGYVYAILGAIAFSGKGILIKLSYLHKVDAMTLIMYRMLFSLPFFLCMAIYAERRARRQGHCLSKKDILGVMVLGSLDTTSQAIWISWACNSSPSALSD